MKRDKEIVVMTSNYPRWAGDSTPGFILDFAKQMQKLGYKITALAPHYQGASTKETLEGVPTKRFRYWFSAAGETLAYEGGALGHIQKSPVYALKLAWLLTALVVSAVWTANRHKAKILNAHWLVPQGFIAILARPFTRAKVVISIHGGDVFGLDSPLFRKIKAWTLARADAVIVNSSATQAKAESLFAGRDYPIIPMGIDTDLFVPLAAKPKHDKLEILFVGRVASDKGPIYLVKAINELVASNQKKLHLTIVGSGPELARLQSYVGRHKLAKFIDFAGWTQHEELPKYYASADLLVAPSIINKNGWQEAFGLIFAEALACGTAVIGTSTGGIKDIVRDGETGFLVEQKDPTALALAIQKFLDDPALVITMGQRGRKFIVNNFAKDKTAKRYQQIFDELIG